MGAEGTLLSFGSTRLRVQTPDVKTARAPRAPRAPVFNPPFNPASERAGASRPVGGAGNRCGHET